MATENSVAIGDRMIRLQVRSQFATTFYFCRYFGRNLRPLFISVAISVANGDRKFRLQIRSQNSFGRNLRPKFVRSRNSVARRYFFYSVIHI